MEGLETYLIVATVIAAGVLLFAGAMGAARALRPQVCSAEKSLTYESGVDAEGSGWAQSQIRYYLYAFLYLIFAVDAVYLFPWVTVVKDLGWATLGEMGVFLGVIAIGLIHAIRRGVLRWI
ncbi:NADH-quinone oxidoreductase subunit A [Kineosporia mesophila]|uniref:NADH-quinone oxidoreductase subunit n=1 Tax=Kineosporia mesophila TaxID=566012 RepID=A0ABP6ZP36_9ACTN|nr:NADH-quinone oxidoreductase subunit A [Kineosporia mesophila]MCD5350050.1 NADH-quinone oxidoreductase subunit A [Kineosporia mesophila]